jgi:hypothetical protein
VIFRLKAEATSAEGKSSPAFAIFRLKAETTSAEGKSSPAFAIFRLKAETTSAEGKSSPGFSDLPPEGGSYKIGIGVRAPNRVPVAAAFRRKFLSEWRSGLPIKFL